jgi:hypothetical protein
MVVVGCWWSGVIVEYWCRLSTTFSIVGAKTWLYNIPHFLVLWFDGFGFDAFVFILVMLVHCFLPCYGLMHGLINYTSTKAKCCHLKKLTCKGTLWQVFTRVYRLEIHLVKLVFSTQLCEIMPVSSLWFNSPPLPLPCISILYTYKCIQCVKGGWYEVLGLRQINTCLKVPLHVNFR